MTTEQEQLLLKDISGRLPYGVKAKYFGPEEERDCFDEIEGLFNDGQVDIGQYGLDIWKIKPYLFPMGSMTEEQMDRVEEILIGYDRNVVFDFLSDGNIVFHNANVPVKAFSELIHFFDKEMLDYRGLIDQGLAIDATGLGIYKERTQP